MTRGFSIRLGTAALAEAIGLTLLARPSMFGAGAESARYLARIAGMMLAVLGLFLGGFAIIFVLTNWVRQ